MSSTLRSLAVAAAALLLGLIPMPVAAAGHVVHPELDWAGSQIARHAPPASGVAAAPLDAGQAQGLDVSSYQGNVDWGSVASKGARFAYVKASESTTYTNPYFAQQYNGSYGAGIVRGAYHFATPDTASGTVQADYFVDHGGGWSRDGRTLPGMLDMEWNPYGSACYGLSPSGMVGWVQAFSNEYHARTSRWPVVYTATSWWSQCTGNTGDFSATDPLMLACYCSSPGAMPYKWASETIWQYADKGTFPGDQDVFNGDATHVATLAHG